MNQENIMLTLSFFKDTNWLKIKKNLLVDNLNQIIFI